METVGIRQLKARLSHHLKRVQAGGRLVITDRGREIATISAVETAASTADLAWARRLVAERRATWSGGKPRGSSRRLARLGGPTIASTVLDDRR